MAENFRRAVQAAMSDQAGLAPTRGKRWPPMSIQALTSHIGQPLFGRALQDHVAAGAGAMFGTRLRDLPLPTIT